MVKNHGPTHTHFYVVICYDFDETKQNQVKIHIAAFYFQK